MSPETFRGPLTSEFCVLCSQGLLGPDNGQVRRRGPLVGPDRTGHLVPDRLHALEIAGKCPGIAIGEPAVRMIRHDRHKLATVRSDAGPHRLDNVGLAPLAQARLGIRGQVRRIEDAKAWDLEADLRAGQRTLHVRLAEKGAGGMTAGTILMVARYSPRCVWLCAKADGTDRRLQAAKAAQMIDLMELL
jgi:hypothetical protein